MSAITAKASRKMKKYAVLTREPRCFLGSFDLSWEQRKLSEMCGTFEYGLNAAAKEFDGKNKYIRITDIDDASREFLLSDLSSPDICLDGMSKYLLSSGDIVFARTGASVGKTYIYRENDGIVYFAGFLIRAKVNQDNDAEFVFQSTLSPSYEKYIRITSQRSGQPGVNAQEYGEYDLFAPSKEEQQRIGHFLRGIDNLITLHQRKCALLFSPFQSFISMMFTTSTFSWEQRKAIDIADYSKGNGYSKGDLTDAGTPIILYGRLYTKYQFAISEVDTFAVPRNGAVYSQGNEVIVPASGETAEDIARASAVEKSGVLLGGDLNILRPFDFINPLFLALAISNGEPQKELAKKAQGKSVVHIHNTDIQEVTIAYPSRTEQDRIVSVFRQLDNLITLHQRKCIFFTGRAGRLISTVNKKRITSSWEQRKFEEIAVRSSVICSDDTLPRVEYEDIVSGTGRLNKDIYAKQSSKSGIVFHQGDVLYGKLRPYLQNWLLPTFDGLAVGDFWVLQPQNADSSFLYRLIQSRQFDEVANQSTGTKMPRADWKLVSKTVFSIPSNISEQAAIGTYFTALDSLITLHQRKPFLMKWRTSDANRNQTNRLVL